MLKITCNIFFPGFPHAAVTRRRATDYSRTQKAVYYGRNKLFLGQLSRQMKAQTKPWIAFAEYFSPKKESEISWRHLGGFYGAFSSPVQSSPLLLAAVSTAPN
jgi:hypothetical protein